VLEVRRLPGDCDGMSATTTDDTAAVRIARLTAFASDVLDLADRRADLDLRALIDDLHADLIRVEDDR
jgi:hypothetical protein